MNKSIDEALNEAIRKKTLAAMREMKSTILRLMKKKLTYDYLGIQTGTLRNTANVIMDQESETVYVSIDMDYGRAYETGDWSDVKNGFYKKQWKRGREAAPIWKKKTKRPFMRDSINEADIRSIIKRNMGA